MFEEPIKYYAIATSAVGIMITTPFLFLITQYERANHNRTLINQLASSLIWYGIGWKLTIQIPAIIRYLVGPFPDIICNIETILRNFYSLQSLFYLDAMMLVK